MSKSLWLQYILLVEYFAILMFSVFEQNYGKALYWLGAIILLVGVIVGMK